MPQSTIQHTTHDVVVAASADVLYELIADVGRWSCIFGPTVHAESTGRNGSEELIRIWALANGDVRNWCSLRQLDPVRRRVSFAQQEPKSPVASMSGEWVLQPLSSTQTRVVLEHSYSVTADAADQLVWLNDAVNSNSVSELAALKSTAEQKMQLPELIFSFEDRISVEAAAEDVYDFLYRAQEWPERLPHVARLELTEGTPNVQSMEMDTKTVDGSVHTTRSIRVCFPTESIVYKQVLPPRLMSAHTGRWLLTSSRSGTEVISQHTVVVCLDAIPGVLGAGATVQEAKAFIRKSLGANSTTTLKHAKSYAERRLYGRA